MSFRNTTEYNILLHHWDDAVEKVWPESTKIPISQMEDSCKSISQNPKDLEKLVMSSYRLLKHIRAWLKKKDLPYTEAHRFPNLYTALEVAVATTTNGKGNLAMEASRLEQCSRAAFHWLKTYKQLGRTPSADELNPPKTKAITGVKKIYCHCCKTGIATDDSNMLCSECSGQDVKTNKGRCSLCAGDCTAGMYFCDLCEAYAKKCALCKMPCSLNNTFCEMCKKKTPDKQTSIIIDRSPGGHVGSPVMRGPMDMTDALQQWGDIMLPSRRWGVH